MVYHVFVDNSNLWIEGKYVSAVLKGLAKNLDDAHINKIEDREWRIDFGKLLRLVTNDDSANIKTAMVFGSIPPEDSLWNMVESCGFKTNLRRRNSANKEKAVDTDMTHQIAKCLLRESTAGDIFVIATGDKDFMPSIEEIKAEDRISHLAFWNHAAWELKDAADKFIDLTENIKAITY